MRGRDLLWVVAIAAAALLLMRMLVAGRDITVAAMLGLLLLQSLVPLAAAHVIVVRGRGVRWAEIGLRPAPRHWYGWAALAAVLAVPLIGAVNWLVQGLTGAPFRNPQIEILAPVAISWWALAAVLAIAAIVAPIAEEVVFRGLLYGWLRRRLGVAGAAPLSALGFALAHGIAILVPALLVVGVVAALFFERSRSLWPPIVLHGAFNAIMTGMLFAGLALEAPGG